MPRIARPRVSRCSVAAACAVTAGLRRPVSVTLTPRDMRPHSIARGEVPEHGPRLHVRIEGWHELGCTAILLLPQRTREQSVEVVRNPKRVDAVGESIQIIGSF